MTLLFICLSFFSLIKHEVVIFKSFDVSIISRTKRKPFWWIFINYWTSEKVWSKLENNLFCISFDELRLILKNSIETVFVYIWIYICHGQYYFMTSFKLMKFKALFSSTYSLASFFYGYIIKVVCRDTKLTCVYFTLSFLTDSIIKYQYLLNYEGGTNWAYSC